MSLTDEDLVLLALQDCAMYSPVQVQKLLFLMEEQAPQINKKIFKFVPYHYGPFAKEVYVVLDELAEKGLVNIHCSSDQKHRKYCLTKTGASEAKKTIRKIHNETNEYIKELAHYVRTQSFTSLVSAIYRDYPAMKVNSVFNS